MAGAFQQKFETKAGQWTEVRLPFDDFGLNVFGRSVPNPPALDPAKIESIGVTLSDKKAGAFALDAVWFAGNGGNFVYVDRAHDLVAVLRWVRNDALAPFTAALTAALPAGAWPAAK